MSEWRGTGTHVMRTYAEGLYASAREATGWDLWAAPRPRDAVEIVATGPECLPFSRDLCDAAAVAWVLIALAKRAAAWATEVDAGLARSYRAAVAEHRVARRAWARALEADRAALEPEYQRTARAGFVALDALERGCP